MNALPIVTPEAEPQTETATDADPRPIEVAFRTDAEGRWCYLSPSWEELTGLAVSESLGRQYWEHLEGDEREQAASKMVKTPVGELFFDRSLILDQGGREVAIDARAVLLVDEHGDLMGSAGVLRDAGDRLRHEIEVRHNQKLESVGRLAAGIAHEINTPVQFVGDNLRFLNDAFVSVIELLERYRSALDGSEQLSWQERRESLHLAEADADVEYLAEEVPSAIEQSLDGITRVASIVRAMKAFGHPDRAEMLHADLNEALSNTLIVARNELKYVADVETDFGDIPRVRCHPGDVNQVFLNLLVNAAHAIGEAEAEKGRGIITVRTWQEGDDVCISVTDTGAGVPAAVRERIFDPFFTTKDVGEGTGQGLSLARAVIVEKHAGSIDFSSEEGEGTTFVVRLPVDGATTEATS